MPGNWPWPGSLPSGRPWDTPERPPQLARPVESSVWAEKSPKLRNSVVSDLLDVLEWLLHVLGQVPHVEELLDALHDVDELGDGLRGLIRPLIDIFSKFSKQLPRRFSRRSISLSSRSY